jgi:hypothetical protein
MTRLNVVAILIAWTRDRVAVNESLSANPPPPVCRRDLLRACIILSAIVLVAIPIAAQLATQWRGSSTWFATLVAAGVCWLGATVSLVVAYLGRQRGAAMMGLMLSMLVRMAIPLAIALLVVTSHSALAEGGLMGQLLIFYLLTLTVETLLSVSLVKGACRKPQGGPRHA